MLLLTVNTPLLLDYVVTREIVQINGYMFRKTDK